MSSRRLLLIAGPMAVGKTTLIARLMAGELEDVRQRLGVDAAEEWHVLDKSELPMLDAARPARKILCHYDILDVAPDQTFRDAVEPSVRAAEWRVVTLWAAPSTLQDRIVKRDFHGWPPAPSKKSNWSRWSRWVRWLPRWLRDSLARHIHRGSYLGLLMRRTLGITPLERAFHVLECYRDPASVSAFYESWRELCIAKGAEQLFIDTTDGDYRFVEQPPWSVPQSRSV
jgi:hypothetical protein